MSEEKTLDLDAIEARAAKATPGPWINGDDIDEPRALAAAARPRWSLLAVDKDGMAIFDTEDDARFIAAARTDVPSLVARVRALEAQARRFSNENASLWAMVRAWRSSEREGQAAAGVAIERVHSLTRELDAARLLLRTLGAAEARIAEIRAALRAPPDHSDADLPGLARKIYGVAFGEPGDYEGPLRERIAQLEARVRELEAPKR